MAMQPVELFALLNWDYFRSGIVKYVTRYQAKNGREDLLKARHLFRLAEELQVRKGCTDQDVAYVSQFIEKNRLSQAVAEQLVTGTSPTTHNTLN